MFKYIYSKLVKLAISLGILVILLLFKVIDFNLVKQTVERVIGDNKLTISTKDLVTKNFNV